jgi:hypothetical protein
MEKPFPSIPNHPILSNGLQALAEASEKKRYAYIFVQNVKLGDDFLLKSISGLWTWEFKCDTTNMDPCFMYLVRRLSFDEKEDTLPLPKNWYRFDIYKNKVLLREGYQIIFSRTKIRSA